MAAPPVAPREAAAPAPAYLVDTHVHLTDRRFAGDLDAVMARARDASVAAFVVVGYDAASSEAAVALAERHPDCWAAVGIHPHYARGADAGARRRLEALAGAARVVAVGECGLDYYRSLSPAETQREVFSWQLELAERRKLPVVVHSRDAMAETLALLSRQTLPADGVMHCFDGTPADALAAVALGLHVSCAGPITYRKDPTLATAIAAVPAERLVVETDCPYLSPAGHRGERNEPANVRLVAEAVARIRGVRFEEMAHQTTLNAQRLFRLPALPAADHGQGAAA